MDANTVGQEVKNMSDADKQPHQELVEKILSKLEFFISSNMETLFKEADEILFKSAESAVSIADQNNNFEFMNALRAQKGNIEKSFVNEFNLYIKPVSEIKELPKKKHHNQSNQLGLIEQDEMDEMVTLKTISSKSEMNLQEELSHLDARFEHLALKNQNIFNAKALKAQYFCDAFQQAMTLSDLPNENKLTLFKMFGEYFINQLKALYDETNQLLIFDGILPQIELTGKINKSEDRSHHEDVVDEEYPGSSGNAPQRRGSSGGGANRGGYAGGGQQGGASGGGYAGGGQQGGGASGSGGGGGYAGGGQQGGGASGSGGGYAGGGQQGGASGGGQAGGGASSSGDGNTGGGQQNGAQDGSVAGGRMSAGRPVAQINQSIQGFVGGKPADSDSAISTGAGGGGGYYTHNDVVGALSNIQVDSQLLPNTNLGFDADAIKKALLTAIGDTKGGVVDKRVHQVSEKTIDFIKLIFDAIIDDKGISDTIKTLLLSLQIPIIKAAMIDSDFFVDDQHPARQLLDKLAEAGVGVVDQHDPVYIDVEKIVKTLLEEYKEDISAFEEALIALTELTEEIYRKARNQEETSQQELKHQHARTIVLQEIRKVTLGKELPAKIRTLVLKVWPSLMFNHYLKNGKANDEWVELLMILDKIVDSVQPIDSLAELEELGLTNDDIINAAREKLKKCHKSSKVLDQVLDDLKKAYDDLLASRESLEKAEAAVRQKAEAEAAAKEKAELEAKAKSEAEAKAKVEAEAKAKAEAEAQEKAKAAAELEAKAEAEAQEKAKAAAELEAKAAAEALKEGEEKKVAEAKEKAKAAADAKAKAEAEAKVAAEEKAKAEAEAKVAAEEKAKAEAEAKVAAEEKAKAEADAKAAADAKATADAKAEAEAKAKSEAKAAAEAEVKAEVEAESQAEETEKEIAKTKIDNLPADVQPSSWYIVYNGEDKPVRRLKLAVILVQDATLVFVDHLGNVVIEKDADVFSKELENGLSGIIMQHSVFDHALNAALDSIKK